MSAETGVGPSIASGNQTCRGNCADLPTAPMNIIPRASCKSPEFTFAMFSGSKTYAYSKLPSNKFHSITSPITRNTSPTRVVRNAFFAAYAALGLS